MAFGSHEWLTKANTGDMHMPMGASEYEVKVNVFVVN